MGDEYGIKTSTLNNSDVLERTDQITIIFYAFQTTHMKLKLAETSEHRLNEKDEMRYLDRIDQQVFQLIKQGHNWIRNLEARPLSHTLSRTPSVSSLRSQFSRRSSRPSVSRHRHQKLSRQPPALPLLCCVIQLPQTKGYITARRVDVAETPTP